MSFDSKNDILSLTYIKFVMTFRVENIHVVHKRLYPNP